MPSVYVFQPTKRKGVKTKIWWMGWLDEHTKKRNRVSTGARLKKVAERIAAEKERQLLLDPWGLNLKRLEPVRWSDLQIEFLSHSATNNRPQTAYAYKVSLDHFDRLYGSRFTHEINISVLQDFVQHRRKQKTKGKPISVATINKDLRAIRATLNFAVDRGYLSVAPKFKSIMLRQDLIAPIVIAPEHRRSVYTTLEDPKLELKVKPAAWWRILFKIIEELGVRRGEAMSLTWDDVDFDAGVVTVHAGGSKGRRYRPLPLSPELLKILAAWKTESASGEDHILPWSHTTYRQLYTDWHLIIAAAGIPKGVKLVPKSLRSTCGSELIAAGASTMAVKDFLGHASVTTTETHYINSGSSLRAASEARQKHLGVSKLPLRLVKFRKRS